MHADKTAAGCGFLESLCTAGLNLLPDGTDTSFSTKALEDAALASTTDTAKHDLASVGGRARAQSTAQHVRQYS